MQIESFIFNLHGYSFQKKKKKNHWESGTSPLMGGHFRDNWTWHSYVRPRLPDASDDTEPGF